MKRYTWTQKCLLLEGVPTFLILSVNVSSVQSLEFEVLRKMSMHLKFAWKKAPSF